MLHHPFTASRSATSGAAAAPPPCCCPGKPGSRAGLARLHAQRWRVRVAQAPPPQADGRQARGQGEQRQRQPYQRGETSEGERRGEQQQQQQRRSEPGRQRPREQGGGGEARWGEDSGERRRTHQQRPDHAQNGDRRSHWQQQRGRGDGRQGWQPRGGGGGRGRGRGRSWGAPAAEAVVPPPPLRREPPEEVPFPHIYGYGPGQRWHVPTGLAVTWLGTSSGTPTRDRNISCTVLRTPRASFMVDCGEGSLVQMGKTRLNPGSVRAIFVTHLHGDHCFGLASMAAAILERRRQQLAASGGGGADGSANSGGAGLHIYGPPGLAELLRAQMVLTGLHQELALPLTITEFVEDEESAHPPQLLNEGTVFLARMAPRPQPQVCPPELARSLSGTGLRHVEAQLLATGPKSYVFEHYKARPDLVWTIDFEEGVTVTAAQLQHRLPCWGYVFDEKLPAPGDGASWDELCAMWRQFRKAYEEGRAQRGAAPRGGADGGERGAEGAAPDASSGSAAAAGGDDAAAAGAERGRKQLQQQQQQEEEGEQERAGDPLPPPALLPRRVVILGDTMDSSALAPACLGADLLSHEATYSHGMEAKAARAQHSTAWMAGQFARAVGARALVLTHFSARYRPHWAGGDAGSDSDSEGGAGGGGRGQGGRGRAWAGGRGAGSAEVEADHGTLTALMAEAAGEFGSTAVCAAKDLFTIHVSFRQAAAEGGQQQGEALMDA